MNQEDRKFYEKLLGNSLVSDDVAFIQVMFGKVYVYRVAVGENAYYDVANLTPGQRNKIHQHVRRMRAFFTPVQLNLIRQITMPNHQLGAAEYPCSIELAAEINF